MDCHCDTCDVSSETTWKGFAVVKKIYQQDQRRMQEFWKGALRITDEGGPTMPGGDVPENFKN